MVQYTKRKNEIPNLRSAENGKGYDQQPNSAADNKNGSSYGLFMSYIGRVCKVVDSYPAVADKCFQRWADAEAELMRDVVELLQTSGR